ncbi:MAG: hypothetical protein NTW86_17355 [Candidatus Sumerlaeota bacterium]|nr:hypothetical protein [Candidatus Sumerlaeota bacterium]
MKRLTSRERMLRTLRREPVDCVPATPDTSNMIPARLTGKPFWDIYLYQNPPLWKAYIHCAKHFNFEGWVNAHLAFPDEAPKNNPWRPAIVERTDERIATQRYRADQGRMIWEDCVTVYPRDNPPTSDIRPISKIGLPDIPEKWEPLEGVKEWPEGEDLFELIAAEMGDQGVVGVNCGGTVVVSKEEGIFEYFDHPEVVRERARNRLRLAEERFERIARMKRKPDFIACGGSGTLIWQNPAMVRELALPIVKRVTALAKAIGVPTHIHSCGPERALVEMCALETDLTAIDPLEVPPMGDCDLADLKKRFGAKLVLKGNLHTTQVMLHGTPEDVVAASKRAIDDAAAGGGFVLSTGDQCGRDTPDENLYALIETARTYGRY